jgi:hypothetical protein
LSVSDLRASSSFAHAGQSDSGIGCGSGLGCTAGIGPNTAGRDPFSSCLSPHGQK